MKKEGKKGCVYFFRHIGLTPVKIGSTSTESCIDRFNEFRKWAPYGSELIGFINSTDQKELEALIQNKYSNNKINGEWFEIDNEQVAYEIEFHSNIEEVEAKNLFQQEYALFLKNKNNKVTVPTHDSLGDRKQIYLEKLRNGEHVNRSLYAKEIRVSRSTLFNWEKAEFGKILVERKN